MDSREMSGIGLGGIGCGPLGCGNVGMGLGMNWFNSCGEFQSPRFRLGVSNVPMQRFHRLLCPEEALRKGTIFAELYMPFHGSEEVCK